MQEALYHPHYGYYAKKVRGIGAGGDFSTSVTLHEALPRALAAWAAACRHEVWLAAGGWHVIELGGGGGQLASGFLRALGWFGRRRVRYHLVEISEPLRALQQKNLRNFAGKVQWHTDMVEAMKATEGRTIILSNEFVDAFPCVQLARCDDRETAWEEVMVEWPEASLRPLERLVPWSGGIQSSVLEPEHLSSIQGGGRVEIHHSYKLWLESWVSLWREGRLLTIDYGDVLPELYHRRPQGTLRAYAHHQRIVGPGIYANFGQQDLTADVNFTDLGSWGTALGMASTGFCTQAKFIGHWLPKRRQPRGDVTDSALDYLLDEAGVGGAFKVLEQVRQGISDTRR